MSNTMFPSSIRRKEIWTAATRVPAMLHVFGVIIIFTLLGVAFWMWAGVIDKLDAVHKSVELCRKATTDVALRTVFDDEFSSLTCCNINYNLQSAGILGTIVALFIALSIKQVYDGTRPTGLTPAASISS